MIPDIIRNQLWSRMSSTVGRSSYSGLNSIFSWVGTAGRTVSDVRRQSLGDRNRSVSTWCSDISSRRRLLDVAFAPPPPPPSRSYDLYEMHIRGPPKVRRVKQRPLDGNPFMKGVVLKTLIKNPKKPNSGNRKCVLLRLSNGTEKLAHVPGVGHTLQEHNIVLVKCRRLKDTPGVWLKVVRGKYDCGHVIRKPHYTKK